MAAPCPSLSLSALPSFHASQVAGMIGSVDTPDAIGPNQDVSLHDSAILQHSCDTILCVLVAGDLAETDRW